MTTENPQPRRPHRKKRLRLWLGVAVLLFAVGAMVGFLVVRAQLDPATVRQHVLSKLLALLPPDRCSVQLESARFTFAGGLELEGLKISPPGEQEQDPWLSVENLAVSLSVLELLGDGPAVRRVAVEGASVRLHRLQDGRWEHHPVVELLRRPEDRDDSDDADGADEAPFVRLPRILIRGGAISYRDDAFFEEPIQLALADVSGELLSVEHGTDSEVVIAAHVAASGSFVPRLVLDGSWTPSSARLRLDRLRATFDLEAMEGARLPRSVSELQTNHRLGGRIDLDGSLDIDADGQPQDVEIAITVTRGRFATAVTGFSCHSVTGRLEIDDRGIRIERLAGISDAGDFSSSGFVATRSLVDWPPSVVRTQLDLSLPRVEVNAELLDRMEKREEAAGLVDVLRANGLHGATALDLHMDTTSWPPGDRDLKARIALLDFNATPGFFRQRVEEIRGEITFEGGKFRIPSKVVGSAGTGIVELSGELDLHGNGDAGEGAAGDGSEDGPAIAPRGELRAYWRDATACQALRDVLPEVAHGPYDQFDPEGRGDIELRFSWQPPRLAPVVGMSLLPRRVQFRYEGFPVVVRGTHGALHFDLSKQTMEIPLLEAEHHGETVSGRGRVSWAGGETSIQLRISCPSLTLDPELLEALPDEPAGILRRNRVSGRAGVEIAIDQDAGDKVKVGVTVDMDEERQIVIHPPEFPFPVVLGGGRIEVDENRFALEDVSSITTPRLVVSGACDLSDPVRPTRLSGRISDFALDERVLAVLPPKTREKIRGLGLRGEHDFHFETRFPLASSTDTDRDYMFRIWDLHSRGAALNIGMRLTDIEAVGEIHGEGKLGDDPGISGRLTLQSARFEQLLLEDATLHVVYGMPHPALSAEEGDGAAAESGYVVGDDFRQRLERGPITETLQLLLGPARLYGGKIKGFCYADLGVLRDLRAHIVTSGVDVGLAARDLFQNDKLETTGIVSGEVRFGGIYDSLESLLGLGQFEITGGNLADLPVISIVLGKLGIDSPPLFHSCKSRFSIRQGRFNAGSGDLLVTGPAMNLRGSGTVDFNDKLDLRLVPEFIPGKIDVLDRLKQNLAYVRVTGPRTRPRAELVFLRVVPLPLGKP